MKLVAVLHQGLTRFHSPLVSAVINYKLPLIIHPAEPKAGLEAALLGLGPLSLSGAIVEDAVLQASAAQIVKTLEAEAQSAGRADLVIPERAGLRGYFLEPLALGNLLVRYAYGDKALWIGPGRPELASGLRGVSKVSVFAKTYPEGDNFLGRIPGPQRGHVVVGDSQAEAVARQVDTVIFAGGSLPLSLLQPYHTLVGLEPPSKDIFPLIGQYLGPDELLRFHLSALLDVLGHALPPEAFA